MAEIPLTTLTVPSQESQDGRDPINGFNCSKPR